MPVVQEALGCLMSLDLHPRLGGRPPTKFAPLVILQAAFIWRLGWHLSVSDERALRNRSEENENGGVFLVVVAKRVWCEHMVGAR